MTSIRKIRNARWRPEPTSPPQWVDIDMVDDTIRSITPASSLELGERVNNGAAAGEQTLPTPELADDVLDAGGAFVIPGLINLHTHLFRKEQSGDPTARVTDPVAMTTRALCNGYDYLSRGVTTVRDVGAPMDLDIALGELEESGQVTAPRIVACGRPLTQTGGHHHDFGVVVDGADNVRRAVRERVLCGARYVKLMASLGSARYVQHVYADWQPAMEGDAREIVECIIGRADPDKNYAMTERDGYTVEELSAAVDEADRQGLRTCAHAVTSQSLINCVLAGFTTVEHGTFMNRSAATVIANSDTVYVPTISAAFSRVLCARSQGGSDPLVRWAGSVAEPWFAALRMAHDAGLVVAVGTDRGGEMGMEMELIHRAGYSRYAALRGATEVAAEVLGRPDLGRIAPQNKADLVLLAGDPLEDLATLSQPLHTIKGGKLFAPHEHRL